MYIVHIITREKTQDGRLERINHRRNSLAPVLIILYRLYIYTRAFYAYIILIIIRGRRSVSYGFLIIIPGVFVTQYAIYFVRILIYLTMCTFVRAIGTTKYRPDAKLYDIRHAASERKKK